MNLDRSPARRVRIFTLITFAALLVAHSEIASGQVVAQDDFSGAEYDSDINYNQDGGVGFGPITYLGGTGGDVFSASLDGRALGMSAGNEAGNSQTLGRSIDTSVAMGVYTLSASFNVTNTTGFSGFNLKTTLGTGLGDGELLSIGLLPGQGSGVFYVTDGSVAGSQTFALGSETDLRSENIDFSISFDTSALTYSVTATVRSSGQSGGTSGTLIDTNGAASGTGSLAAIGLGNFNSGEFQDVIIDNLVVTAIPEPSTVSLLAASTILGGCFYARRRKR